ncbi:MAG: tRNA (adenosine(37)-N6)-threonylcarbamoyltransferase complex transferase subunit TsaD [FCB group bacterium]|jgi:N6-L-threonylcarbamoyladenine synthase
MKILAIESSCDETSIAVIQDSKVLSNVISSQYVHSQYGGVIPELASRAHLQVISTILKDSLLKAEITINKIDAIAVTSQPGLIGSLIVGSNFAKGLAVKYNIPIIPVNHIEGHIYSGCLQDDNIKFPLVSLVVSGGHTALFFVESFTKYEMIGSTIDDAAGEAFDKVASMLGFGYPGGPEIDKLAQNGNPHAYNFPRPLLQDSNNFNFSFSGLKTSVKYFLAREFPNGISEEIKPDIAASFQEAVVEVLVNKSLHAAREYKVKNIIIAGGVSANSALRKQIKISAEKSGIKVIIPQLDYCMDNAAMIGFIAEKKVMNSDIKYFNDLTFTVGATALRASRNKKSA